jgi:chemotaxis protein MotB
MSADKHGKPDEHGAKHGAEGAHGGAAGGEHAEHAEDHGGGHHKSHSHDHPPGTPPWLISFGDMMTLFLCFFIMLVTMASTQDAGLMANGLGPLAASLESGGMDSVLKGAKVLESVNRYRERFGLQQLTEEEFETGHEAVHDTSVIQQLIHDAMKPSFSLGQPLVAKFSAGSAELTEAAQNYLDMLAETLRPGHGQVLVLEGHANDAGEEFSNDDAELAWRRAAVVANYLVKEHGFSTVRVEPRAWAREEAAHGSSMRGVDARLVQPSDSPDG